MADVEIDPLKKTLTFGDNDQIIAIRKAERQAEWDALPDCKECGGDVYCKGRCETCSAECQSECQRCEFGKEPRAEENFFEKYPNFQPR